MFELQLGTPPVFVRFFFFFFTSASSSSSSSSSSSEKADVLWHSVVFDDLDGLSDASGLPASRFGGP